MEGETLASRVCKKRMTGPFTDGPFTDGPFSGADLGAFHGLQRNHIPSILRPC